MWRTTGTGMAGAGGTSSAGTAVLLDSPACGCYLLAVAALPFRWLSPVASVYQHGEWSDVLVGMATAVWVLERGRVRRSASLRVERAGSCRSPPRWRAWP